MTGIARQSGVFQSVSFGNVRNELFRSSKGSFSLRSKHLGLSGLCEIFSQEKSTGGIRFRPYSYSIPSSIYAFVRDLFPQLRILQMPIDRPADVKGKADAEGQ